MNDHPSHAPGQLHLHFRHVAPLSADEEETILDWLSSSEAARLASIESPGRRLEYLVSRRLMRDALSGLFDEAQHSWQFEERLRQQPLIANLPRGQHTNLSHSKGLICFAIADTALGVDIEACQQQRDYGRLAKLFMTEDERRELTRLADPSNYFYRCWCAKEAFYKAQPKAEQGPLHFTAIAVAELDRSDDWYLIEGSVDEHYLVAATRRRKIVTRCHYYPRNTDWPRPFVPTGD